MKYFWIGLGFLAFGLGVLGIFVPLLPTTPFFLLTVFAFSKSSDRFSAWFQSTKFYTQYIENYKPGRPLSIRKKLEILIPVFLLLSISFYLVENIYSRGLLLVIFIAHLIYFGFVVATEKNK